MSRRRLNHAAAVIAFFISTLIISSPASSGEAIEFLQPQQDETVTGQTVAVKLRFSQPIDQTTFSATLNGKDVTAKFSLNGSGGNAVLSFIDGLKTNGNNDRGTPNHIVIKVRQKAAPSGDPSKEVQRLVTDLRFFFKVGSGGGDPSQVTATIPPIGGHIALDGYGTVTFPANSFPSDQQVSLYLTSDPNTAYVFGESTILFSPGPRASNELRINTGLVPPTQSINVALTVPATLLASMPLDHEPVLFILIQQTGGDEMQKFELYYPHYDSITHTLTATLPSWIFSLAMDGRYESIIVVGTNAVRQTVAPVAGVFFFDTELMGPAASCTWAPDVHKILFPPLDGQLVPKSSFGYRPSMGRPHFGTDYRTLNYATLSYEAPDPAKDAGAPVTGLPVRSMKEGTIVAIGNQIDATTGQGWGDYIVIRHTDDGSKALYAHLEPNSASKIVGARIAKGEIIARSGQSGLDLSIQGVGPHLHVEFAPLGVDPQARINNNYWAKASVEPCIKHDLYVPLVDPRIIGGIVLRYDLTSAYQLDFATPVRLPAGLPSRPGNSNSPASATGYNRHLYAAGGPATLDGVTFATYPDQAAFGIAVNRSGVLVGDTTHSEHEGRENKIHIYSHDGMTEKGFFTVSGFFDDMYIGASDELICAFDNIDYATAVFNANRIELFRVPSGSNTCAATDNRVYVTWGTFGPTGPLLEVLVYDNNGQLRQSVKNIPYWIDGIAVTEKNLFVSGHYQSTHRLLVYSRSVQRDSAGQITSDAYTFKGELALGNQPGSIGVE